MQFYRDMYVSPEIEHPEITKWRLRHRAGSLSLYVITLCDEGGQLQFFHSAFLEQRYLRQHCPMIIGLARGRTNAVALIQKIVQECVDSTGGAELVPFLAKRDVRISLPEKGEQS